MSVLPACRPYKSVIGSLTHTGSVPASGWEIVLPVMDSAGEVLMVLDVDSDLLDDFSEIDREGLQAIIDLIEKNYSTWV